ncbi:MAG: hypothetical protein KY475_01840 [Planctomycetes bacterium]|nr:hypothetical protein [Planctomycetota bacterium]
MKTSLVRAVGVLVCLASFVLGASQAGAQDEALRREVRAWLDANYVDSDASFAAKVRGQVEQDLVEGNDFLMSFGPRVMRPGRAHQIHVFAGRFYAFPLTEAQRQKLMSSPDGVSYAGGKRGYQIEPTRAFVWNPQIENAAGLDPRSRINGAVTFEGREPLPEKLAVRMSYRIGRTTTQKFYYLDAIPAENRGTLSFSMDPLMKEDDKEEIAGPLVVFVDLCEIVEELDPQFNTRTPKIKVYSNSAPVLLDVGAASQASSASSRAFGNPSPSSRASGLVGSKWRFGGTDTTVEFLEGGKFLWSGSATNGFWKQEGATVTINVNNFTLFQFILEGDRMTGTWERLQGEDVGEKNFSSLQRI